MDKGKHLINTLQTQQTLIICYAILLRDGDRRTLLVLTHIHFLFLYYIMCLLNIQHLGISFVSISYEWQYVEIVYSKYQ